MDLEDDVTAGFDLISTWDLDEHGVEWIAKKIKQRVGTGPVVISLDVDVMDPSYVPASKSSSACISSPPLVMSDSRRELTFSRYARSWRLDLSRSPTSPVRSQRTQYCRI